MVNLKEIVNKDLFLKKDLFDAINSKSVLKIRNIVEKLDEKDIALFLNELPTNQQFFFIRSLPTVVAAEIINALDDEILEKIINSLTKVETQKIISFLYSDDIVDLIEDLPPKLVNKILKSCSSKQRKNINHILNYTEGTVGYEMNVDFIKLKETSKISEVIEEVKLNIVNKIPEEQKYFYVVDNSDRLVGYVSTLDLFINSDLKNKTINFLVKKDVVSISVFESKDKLSEILQKYEISHLPVVDMNERLIGVIDTEQSIEIMQDVEIEDVNRQVGITKSGFKKYFELNILEMFKSRIFWLGITFLISTISQLILKLFLDSDNSIPNTSFIKVIIPYLPFILTLVGNVALQSTAMIIKNITLNEVTKGNYFKAFVKEFKVSMLILFSIIILNIPRVLIIDLIIDFKDFKVEIFQNEYWKNLGIATLVIIISLSLSVFLSAGLPILATNFNKDPSLMSSPLLTTLIDLSTTLIALLLGFLILGS